VSGTSLEVLTVGRVGVDLYPEQTRVPLAEVRTFAKSLGGTATNVAVAASRLGHSAAVVTKVGDDPFGPYVRLALAGFGVDTSHVGTDPVLRTPIVFAELDPPEDPGLLFYRAPKAPDMNLDSGDLEQRIVEQVPIFWVTGTGFSDEPSRSTLHTWLVWRARRTHTILDMDYRSMFWSSAAEAGAHISPVLDHVTVAVGNTQECEVAVGTPRPDEAADRLLDRGVAIAVVKLGGDGVLVATNEERQRVPPVPVDVVCGLGAGDAFGGALCHGLLSGWDPVATVRFANAAGAIVAGRLACADAMPDVSEVEAVLGVGSA
jgi:5-dehydro-2-deoxygluconokinase